MILIVHDHPGVAHAIGHSLTRAEIPWTHVPTCAEAKHAIQVAWKGVILDLHLPDGSGLDILRALRGLPAHGRTPVYVVTADVLIDDRTAAAIAAEGAQLHVGVLQRMDILNICLWLLTSPP